MAKVELKRLCNAWLSPKGIIKTEIEGCKTCDCIAFHHDIAIHIIAKERGVSCREVRDICKSTTPTEILENMRWIRLCCFSRELERAQWIIQLKQRQTKAQKEVIAAWLVANNLSVEQSIVYV